MADPALAAAVGEWLRRSPAPAPPPRTDAAALAAMRRADARRRHAADPLAFARELLPLHFSLPVAPAPFHMDMLATFARLRTEGAAGRSVREVYEAPRSWAKSTYAATLLPLLAACLPEVYGLRYVVLCRARQGLAEEDVDGVRRLLDGDLIRAAYGDLEGPTWNRGLLVTAGGVRIQAAGLDQGNRGLRDPATGDRPDLVIIDDPDKDAQGAGVRRKLRDNLKGALLGMQGAAGRPMHVLCVGTVVDSRATVRWLREQPGFRHRTYRAIGQWPDEVDGLWREWERLWLSDDEAGSALAHTFYEGARAAMDAGATGLWEGDPIERVMEARLVMGAARFAAEKLNDPRGGDDALIRAERIRWWGGDGDAPEGGIMVRDVPASWRASAVAVDPALGRKGGDLTAIVGGRLAADGRIFVEGADVARTPKHLIAGRVADMAARVGATVVRTEEVGAFELLHEPIVDAVRARGLTCAVEVWRPSSDKPARLQGLQPLFEAGLLVLHVSLRGVALDQLLSLREDGTSTEHDDLPDALEMLVGRLRPMAGAGASARRPPEGRRNGRPIGDLGGPGGDGYGDMAPLRGGRAGDL